MLPPTPPEYSPLVQSDEDYGTGKLLEHRYDDAGTELVSCYKKFCSKYWAWLTHCTLLCFSAVLFVLLIQARSEPTRFPVYSPANVAVENNKELTTFNGTINFDSIYRGNPTPELDAAWDRITLPKFIRLTLEQLEKIGKADTPSKVKFRQEDGGGYVGTLEFTHQLHCLDLLRKYTYRDYYKTFDPSFTSNGPEAFRKHLDHCVEIIRQDLMCTADVGIITYEWVRGFNDPYPDFNTMHQCRNFEKILAWEFEHAIHSDISRLGDEVDLDEVP